LLPCIPAEPDAFAPLVTVPLTPAPFLLLPVEIPPLALDPIPTEPLAPLLLVEPPACAPLEALPETWVLWTAPCEGLLDSVGAGLNGTAPCVGPLESLMPDGGLMAPLTAFVCAPAVPAASAANNMTAADCCNFMVIPFVRFEV
jgi:hypothetical protein